MNWQHFMSKESSVVDCLMEEHHLEQRTVLDLIKEHGEEMREMVLEGFDSSVIANELASYVSK
jgi:hypothetical protein